MKNLYASAAALAIAGSALAQSGTIKPMLTEKAFNGQQSSVANPNAHPSGIQDSERAAFYTNDFSGGFPAGWTTVDDATPANETAVNFEWSNDPASVTAAAANQPLILTFLAPGASNGYLWANSDRGLGSAPPTNHLTRLTTTAIDCSGQPTVLLTMQSTIGVFDLDADTACKVRVSTDGVNWTNFAPFPCLVTGNIAPPCERFSDNPQLVSINISSVAANQANVFLQFQWRGGWEYYWAIDDLELSPLPEYEVKLENAFTSQFGGGNEFGRVLSSQMASTMNVGAIVINSGTIPQTNVDVTISLKDPSATEVASTNTAVGIIAFSDTGFVDEIMTLPASMPTGVYTADFTMTSDQIGNDEDPTDNSGQRTFEITDNLYSLDGIGVYPGSILSTSEEGTASYADNTTGIGFLTYYHLSSPTTFYGAEMLLGPSSVAGNLVHFAIYDSTDVVQNSPLSNEITATEDHVVTNAEIASGKIDLAFFDQFSFPAGGYYAAAILTQVGITGELTILNDLTVPQPIDASLLFTPVDPDGVFVYNLNGNAYAIRLSADPSIGINEVAGLPGVDMFPNPTTGVLHINTANAESTTVEVRNMLGAVVKTATFNGTVNKLDLSGNAAGVYTVRIGNGTNYAVQLVTLQ